MELDQCGFFITRFVAINVARVSNFCGLVEDSKFVRFEQFMMKGVILSFALMTTCDLLVSSLLIISGVLFSCLMIISDVLNSFVMIICDSDKAHY